MRYARWREYTEIRRNCLDRDGAHPVGSTSLLHVERARPSEVAVSIHTKSIGAVAELHPAVGEGCR